MTISLRDIIFFEKRYPLKAFEKNWPFRVMSKDSYRDGVSSLEQQVVLYSSLTYALFFVRNCFVIFLYHFFLTAPFSVQVAGLDLSSESSGAGRRGGGRRTSSEFVKHF